MNTNLVSPKWLSDNMNDEKTIIFDATLLKVKPKEDITFKGCIPKTLEFDLIKSFKAQDAKFQRAIL